MRAAAPGDADAIAAVQVDVWRTAYAAFLPETVLAALDQPTAADAWARAVAAPGGAHLLVATETTAAGEEVTGFAAGEGAEIGALLVAPRWGRRGHGGRLLGVLAERLRSGGAQRGLVWVAENDLASGAFYLRHGWQPDGAVRTSHHGADTLRELSFSGPLELAWHPSRPSGGTP